MKFRLTNEYRYPWPVTIRVPDPDRAGEILEQEFTATFLAMPLDEAEALDEEIDEAPARDQVRRRNDVLRRVLVGWDGIEDDDGAAVPFSDDALNAAIQHSWFRIGVYQAYFRSLQGEAPRLGN